MSATLRQAQTTIALDKVCRELREACAQSQHTYTHAQQLLTALSRQLGGDVMRRLSQEVEAAAVDAHGGSKLWPLQRLFVSQRAPQSQYEAAVLVGDILVACGGSGGAGDGALKRVEGPLLALQRLYAQHDTPLEPLRHPVFLDLLLSGELTGGWGMQPCGMMFERKCHRMEFQVVLKHAQPTQPNKR